MSDPAEFEVPPRSFLSPSKRRLLGSDNKPTTFPLTHRTQPCPSRRDVRACEALSNPVQRVPRSRLARSRAPPHLRAPASAHACALRLWVLVLAVRAASVDGPGAVYSSTAGVLFAAQSAAVLEVAHAFLGLVRSPWLVTALQARAHPAVLNGRGGEDTQREGGVPPEATTGGARPLLTPPPPTPPTASFRKVFSRYGVLWGVLYRVPETRAASWSLGSLPLAPELGGGRLALSLGVPSMVLAWGVTEVTRYSFYFFKASRARGRGEGAAGRAAPLAPDRPLARAPPGAGPRPRRADVAAVQRLRGAVPDRRAPATAAPPSDDGGGRPAHTRRPPSLSPLPHPPPLLSSRPRPSRCGQRAGGGVPGAALHPGAWAIQLRNAKCPQLRLRRGRPAALHRRRLPRRAAAGARGGGEGGGGCAVSRPTRTLGLARTTRRAWLRPTHLVYLAQLYNYMLRQRRKVFATAKAKLS